MMADAPPSVSEGFPIGYQNATPSMPQPSPRRGPKPAQVHLDRFAILHLGREHRLSHTDCWLLTVLTLLADWRSPTWIGPLLSLANDARMSTNTARRSLARLEAAGVIAIVSPFEHHSPGEVEVLCYANLVCLSDTQRRIVVDTALIASQADLRGDEPFDQPEGTETARNKDAVKGEGAATCVGLTVDLPDRPSLGRFIQRNGR